MKRTLSLVACAVVLVGAAALSAAESSTTITVKPSDMRDGESKTVTDDGRTIIVRRDGDTTRIEIEGAGKTESLTITREGDRIRIGRIGPDGTRSLIVPHRNRVLIDGFSLDDLEKAPKLRAIPGDRMQTYFVCPKDKTTLRVPKEHAEESFKCPVDGTTMEKRKGHGFTFFFDDSAIEL
ncbi:MAG TPA: hypothetical protein VF057_01350 [Thermoanaerobaculia bacterium]